MYFGFTCPHRWNIGERMGRSRRRYWQGSCRVHGRGNSETGSGGQGLRGTGKAQLGPRPVRQGCRGCRAQGGNDARGRIGIVATMSDDERDGLDGLPAARSSLIRFHTEHIALCVLFGLKFVWHDDPHCRGIEVKISSSGPAHIDDRPSCRYTNGAKVCL